MDPFAALMRTYCIDYTNSHDLSVCDSIMEPDYVVRICGLALERDTAYKPSVEDVFRRFPALGLVVHELVTNGDRLAMRFSEHGATASGVQACWAGIGLYDWNGSKLVSCRVEQDFWSQRRQLDTGIPDALEPPHLDPWLATTVQPSDPDAEATVRSWLATGDLAAAESGRIDEGPPTAHRSVLEPEDVEVLDLFSAGDRVAFHATLRGTYLGGLDRGRPPRCADGARRRRPGDRGRRADRRPARGDRSLRRIAGDAARGWLAVRADWLDLRDPDFYRRDPQDVWARLRETNGLVRDRNGFVALARFADVLTAEHNAADLSNARGYRVHWEQYERTMISQDDPAHIAQRRRLAPTLTPRAVQAHADGYRSLVRELVDAALDEHAATGAVEIVDALAAPLPCRITATLIGFDEADWRKIKDWSERQMRLDTRDVDPDIFDSFNSSVREWMADMQQIIPERTATPHRRLVQPVAVPAGRPGAAVDERHGDGGGPARRRWCRDDQDADQPRSADLLRPSRTVGTAPRRARRASPQPSRSCCDGSARSTTCSAPPCATPRSTVSRSPRASGWRCSTRPPIVIPKRSATRTGSTSPTRPRCTWRSGTAPTSVSAPTSPAWRCACCSRS